MNPITLTRSKSDLTVATPEGLELGFILRPTRRGEGFEAWANVPPQPGWTSRAVVSTFDHLRQAVEFIRIEGRL
jgi:hypothetical protein